MVSIQRKNRWHCLRDALKRRQIKEILYLILSREAVRPGWLHCALTENFVLQSLVPQFDAAPHYWSRLNPSYEVDFVIQRENDIIPIEVKSDTNIKSRSLKKYAETFSAETKIRVRFSMNNLRMDDGVLNIPLFMVDQAERLIGIALKNY